MTADEYWYGDPALLYRYENAYLNKQKLKEQDMWLMGTYIIRALEQSRLNVNGFIEKNSQLVEYPECPHTDLFQTKKELTKEQIEVLNEARTRLGSRGLLRDD
jgi:hypothetical protein